MFERFTDAARRVIVLSQQEARALGHNYIGTEHLLLGLVHEGEGVAARALRSLGVSVEAVGAQIEEIIGRGVAPPPEQVPFTPRAKKVLEHALREAMQTGREHIDTEHILLGLLREEDGVACQVLTELGAPPALVRRRVVELPGIGADEDVSAVEGVVESLRAENDRLRDLLRRHGIDPSGAASG